MHCQTPNLPQGLLATGASYDAGASPRAAGWLSAAYLLNKTVGTYSYTTVSLSALHGKPTQAFTSGAAQLVRQWPIGVSLLALIQGGVTTTSTTTSGSIAGGAVGVWQLGKTNWTVIGTMRAITSAGQPVRNVVELGIGRTF